ncbi:uncharacterized protein LOC111870741 isoform X5 [Cryptotermes secundus]|uniref:uncharacterized protein LOC111870741 isoform X5 n=1 Tax=Cryptotermes secundus TaxID=105785 RepID=UPI000CD7DAA1|nr:uncharacterized protein LOC111870741 isoform X5 [Cryptotermes secundus]
MNTAIWHHNMDFIKPEPDPDEACVLPSSPEMENEQNTVIKEEEDDVDVLSEDCIHMKFEEVYIPSAFPIEKVEPENCTDLLKVVSASSSETCLQLSHDGNEFISTKIEAIDPQEEDGQVSKTFTGTEVGQESRSSTPSGRS